MADKQKPSKKDVRVLKEARTVARKKRRDARIANREAYFQRRAEALVGKRARVGKDEGTITDLFYTKDEGENIPAEVVGQKGRVFEIVTPSGTFYRSRRRLKLV